VLDVRCFFQFTAVKKRVLIHSDENARVRKQWTRADTTGNSLKPQVNRRDKVAILDHMASTPRGGVARGLPPTPQGSSPRRRSSESGTRLNGGRNSLANGAPAVVPTVVGVEDPSLDERLLVPWTAASAAALPALSHRHASTYRAGRSSEAGRISGPRRSSEAWRTVRAWHGDTGLLGTALARSQAALGADAALAPTSPREVRSRRSMWDMEDSAVRQRATADLSIGARDTTHCHLSHVVAAYQAAEARRQARCQRDAAAAAAAARRSSIRWGGGPAPSNAKQGETAADAAHCKRVEDAAAPARRMTAPQLGPMPYAPLCIRCRCDLVRVCVCCFI
jgi:hypothetical protein